MSTNFGIIFQEARKDLGVKVPDLVKVVGCTRPYIYQIESGTTNISQGTMERLVEGLATCSGTNLKLEIKIQADDGREVLPEG